MRIYFECTVTKFILIFCFYLFLHTSTAHAKTYMPFNLQELQTKLNIAMHSRLPTYNLSYIGDPSTIKVDVSNIINNLYDKDDYLKYTCKGYRYTALAKGNIITISFTFNYWNTLTQDIYVEKEVNKILTQIITPDMNSYEKEKEIHDWIVKNVQYDVSLINHSELSADIEYALRDIPDIISYSYSKIDFSRTTQSNDVIFKLKLNYFLSPYSNSNDVPFIKPRLLAGSPINSAI